MILKLLPVPGGFSHRVDHKDDFGRLNLDVPSGITSKEIIDYLEDVQLGRGILDDHSTVWVSVQGLRDNLGLLSQESARSFDRMLEYAKSRGWTDSEATWVRVHIVYY